ncbi:MAG: class I SAM-dependent methyltransferase [Candidatus Thermoplasmatota archaeon]|nr:class I SAM-dependent methyltransferase [Candidatus Thermoplasmatota archaeon]
MGYIRAMMFNRKAASGRSMPRMVLDSLPLKKGNTVADIGAGGGYFTLKIAERIGKSGMVYAVDTDERSLSFIVKSAENSGLGNVKAVHTDGGVPDLPPRSLDLVLMRNVCHHIGEPEDYFRKLKGALKQKGIVGIIDYMGSGSFSFHSLFHHSIDEKELVMWMRKAGYRKVISFDFLPEQSFTLFGPE